MALATIGAVAAGIGGLGSLIGMFKDDPEYSLASVESLRLSNPELYDQLMQIKYMQAEAQRAADQKGINAAERIGMDDARSSLRSQQANRGLAGSSVAASQQADMTNRLMAQQQQRAIQQEIARRQQAAQLSGQFLQQSNAILSPEAQARYQGEVAGQQGQNQFFSGLAGAGLNLIGTQQYMDNMPQRPAGSGTGGYYSPQNYQQSQQAWDPGVKFGSSYGGPRYKL